MKVNSYLWQNLERRISREEIIQTVKCMGSFKALGPDGFKAIFFQNQWQVIVNEFCDMVHNIFKEPTTIKEINGTSLTLIPKKQVMSKILGNKSL